jgi:dipeptidyl aminopeptidase/acylaminoacyl peptidase
LPSVFPGVSSHVVSTSDDKTKFVVEVEDTSTPPTYYFIDLERGLNVTLGAKYPELENVKLSETRTVTYVARDGLEVPAYLTIPAGSEAKNLPLIVHPPGGPWSRDSILYDYWVQFFVSRGWAVLQPNLRGSDGYGVKFLRAGRREWGLTMQDDVTDGVKWAVDQGIADPARICIVGGRYRGYAAVQGLVKTPDLYRCGVGLNGVYDLAERLADGRYYTSYRTLREPLPNEVLSTISPLKMRKKFRHRFSLPMAQKTGSSITTKAQL